MAGNYRLPIFSMGMEIVFKNIVEGIIGIILLLMLIMTPYLFSLVLDFVISIWPPFYVKCLTGWDKSDFDSIEIS